MILTGVQVLEDVLFVYARLFPVVVDTDNHGPVSQRFVDATNSLKSPYGFVALKTMFLRTFVKQGNVTRLENITLNMKGYDVENLI